MFKKFYPAIFTKESDGYSVVVPDFDGCFTEGDTIEETYEMTFDAIGLYLSDIIEGNKTLPKASDPIALSHKKMRQWY